MSADPPPALWLLAAATVISAVSVAAMVISDGPRRPLTFAGAVLLPGDKYSTAPDATDATAIEQPSRSPAPRPAARPAATRSAAASTAQYRSPAAGMMVPIGNGSTHDRASTPARTPSPSRSVAAAGSPTPIHLPHTGFPTTPAPGANSTELARALFDVLNHERRQRGLPGLRWDHRLQLSAASHNKAMAAANELASRVGDEPALGVRQADQGVLGRYAAENLGYSTTAGLAGALAVHQHMLAEQPPGDSRRQNLLSTAVNTVGIDVLLDPAHGRLWVTEDFAQLP